MRFCNFPEATHQMGAPANWDPATQGECGVLPVQVTEDGRCRSLWSPDVTERSKIAQGYPIALEVVGGQPPVSVYVSDAHLIPGVDDEIRVYQAGMDAGRRAVIEDLRRLLAIHLQNVGEVTHDGVVEMLDGLAPKAG